MFVAQVFVHGRSCRKCLQDCLESITGRRDLQSCGELLAETLALLGIELLRYFPESSARTPGGRHLHSRLADVEQMASSLVILSSRIPRSHTTNEMPLPSKTDQRS
jgi:hypothetical protein